jgi:hypothetical protein
VLTARDLAGATPAELRALLAAGQPIDPAALDDTEYLGTSLGLPAMIERLTWTTFKKVFHRDPDRGALRGWNVRIDQRAPGWRERTRGGAPATFGHFAVVPLAGRRLPIACPAGLLLDYGRGGNGALDPIARLRDPIVAVAAGSADLLLGWSYLELGPMRVATPSFFTLERGGPIGHVARPARRPAAARA